jgi:hypothetical protein
MRLDELNEVREYAFMQIYSRNIEIFLKGIKNKGKLILNNELGLTYKNSRVHHKGYTYPLKFVVFESPTKLGFFNPHTFQIGLNKKLFLQAKTEVITNILRHELVHFYQYIIYGDIITAHGTEFKKLCTKFGYGEDISSAAAEINILNEKIEGDLASEKLLIKIKKLLSLAESDNVHERELATLKANQLLLKHNLERYQLTDLSEQDSYMEEEVCLNVVLEAKKTTAKMQTIYEILSCFFVQPVFNHGKGCVFLEIIGTRVNVELGTYVTKFLDQELEYIWSLNKKENSLKGLKARNSFFKGVGKGYIEKIKSQHNQIIKGNELILLQKELKLQVEKVYGRLSFGSTSAKTCKDSLSLGKQAGKSLNIRKGITSTSNSHKLLAFFKEIK